MSGDPRYSWIVRDSDDDPWTLLNYRWTDRKAALEEADHWLRCVHHRYAQVETVEVVGDEWTVLPALPANATVPAPRHPARVSGAELLSDTLRVMRPERTFGTPVAPTAFLPMTTEEPSLPPGPSREAAEALRKAMGDMA